MFALVTAAAAAGLDPDLEPLRAAFEELAQPVAVVEWDDGDVDWAEFDAVILRSTWDYVDRLAEFRSWLDVVAEVTRVVNSKAAIDWNIDKHYLGSLAAHDIPIVPTTFVEVGESTPVLDTGRDVWVVKPAIGAGSNGARRCTSAEVRAHVAQLHRSGHAAMVQPYLDLIDHESETALVFVNDGRGLVHDHAFSKAAILTSTDVEQDGDLFAKEQIGARDATADQLDLARQILGSPPVVGLGPLAYARVDVAPSVDGPVLMELELVEPSLYFATSADSAMRAAVAWRRFLRARAEPGSAPRSSSSA